MNDLCCFFKVSKDEGNGGGRAVAEDLRLRRPRPECETSLPRTRAKRTGRTHRTQKVKTQKIRRLGDLYLEKNVY